MRSLKREWPTAAVLVAAAVLAFDVVYLYGTKFGSFVHSDAASTALMAKGALARGLPVDVDWYFANGDVWLFAPQLWAIPFVAGWGIGVGTLLAAVLLGFALEILALGWAYTKLGASRQAVVLGVSLSLIAWSRLHVLFVYIELSYGFVATLYILLFVAHALLFERVATSTSRRSIALSWAACALLALVVSMQNPVRALAFGIGPLLVATAWPWRGASLRARAITASSPLLALALARLMQKLVFERYFTFSTPSGHLAFVMKDLAGMGANALNMARGVIGLVGDMNAFRATSLFGLALLAVSLAVVTRHVLARAPTPLRFACIAALAQLGATALPMLIGNLVVNPVSIRYVMPSMLTVLGLASILATSAMRAQKDTASRLSIAFVALAPLAAVFATLRVIGSYSLEEESTTGQFAHRASHQAVADELTRRGLRHGFASYWNAHLLTLLSHGDAKTCPVNFAEAVHPYRWNTDTWCFDPGRFPDRIFVVSTGAEHEARAAEEASIGKAEERFTVADYEVAVYTTATMPHRWLVPPIADGERLRLPLRIDLGHPQIRVTDNATREGETIAATGTEGTLSFGPYLELPAGSYRVRWIGTPLGDVGELGFDVGVASEDRIVAEKSVRLATLPREKGVVIELSFRLAKRSTGVEFRSFGRGGAKAILEQIELVGDP